ncbi:MAG: hypothetical protein DRO23_10150 [Thermoprotei archaeon]|nr:MAG: hypothetical protein DRO23_10150 [Thermoprotei archaeon]
MYTSVKLKIEAKKKLEELQAKLRLHGIKISLQSLLEKLIELGFEREELLISMLSGRGEDPMLKLLNKPLDWGVEDASTRIDETLYGGEVGSIHRHMYFRSSKK